MQEFLLTKDEDDKEEKIAAKPGKKRGRKPKKKAPTDVVAAPAKPKVAPGNKLPRGICYAKCYGRWGGAGKKMKTEGGGEKRGEGRSRKMHQKREKLP